MGYFRLPDTFPIASEVVAAGNAAIGAYCRCGAWCAANGADGFVPNAIASMIGSRRELDTLERLGLIEAVAVGEVRFATGRVSKKPTVDVVMPEDGYWLPDYLTYNITALEGEALSDRGRKGGAASDAARRRSGQQDVQQQVEQEVEQQANQGLNRQVRSGQVKSRESKPSVTERLEHEPATTEIQTAPGDTVAGSTDQPESVASHVALHSESPPDGQDVVREATDTSPPCVSCEEPFAPELGSTLLMCATCARAERRAELAAARQEDEGAWPA